MIISRETYNKLSVIDKRTFFAQGGTISQQIAPVASSLSHSLLEENSSSPAPSVAVERAEKEQTQDFDASPESASLIYSDGFDIENPVELLFMLDENISSGRVILHPWQIKYMLDFAEGGASDKTPFQSVVRACNGSGKDKYIIAPCVVWLCMKFKKAIGVVTSSSGAQLDNQTCRYIKQLCEALNTRIGHEVWNTKYRHYQCDFGTGKGDISEIFCCRGLGWSKNNTLY